MKLTLGQALYIVSLLWVLAMGILLFRWKSLDMFFEESSLGQRFNPTSIRYVCGAICIFLFVDGLIALVTHWDKVSPFGRIHIH